MTKRRRPPDLHESPTHDIAFGTVPKGWTRSGWIERLRYLVVACADYQADQSDRWRRWMERLEAEEDANGDA